MTAPFCAAVHITRAYRYLDLDTREPDSVWIARYPLRIPSVSDAGRGIE